MPTFLQPLHEFNPCHRPAGSPDGGQFCPTAPFLSGEAKRAFDRKLAFEVDPHLPVRRSSYIGKLNRVDIGLGAEEGVPASRAEILSTARHELGHATDRDYGEDRNVPQRRIVAERTIDGVKVSSRYAQEFGAWRAAIRDSPFGRVKWRLVREALRSYLETDTVFEYGHLERKMHRVGLTPFDDEGKPQWPQRTAFRSREIDRVVDRHVAVLKRYALRVRRGKERTKQSWKTS